MEILILGLILVALMVYASTRIKRTVAEAWEPETVETDDFTIEKPAGILHVLNGDPSLEFEAYSREFGQKLASKIRVVRIDIRSVENTTRAAEVRQKKSGGKVLDDHAEVIDGKKYAVLEIEEGGGTSFTYRVKYKIGDRGGKVYVLRIRCLNETTKEFLETMDVMLESFVLRP